LIAWFSIENRRRTHAAGESVSTANEPVNVRPTSALSSSHTVPEPAQRLTKSDPPEKSSKNEPAVESSWAKELRELKELAAKNPDAALARVAQMPEKHERKTAATDVCLIVAEKEPAKAMAAAWNLELGKFTDESAENAALESLAKQWASADLMKAFVWASALPADDEWRRDRILKGIALAVSEVTPTEAARIVANHINPESSVQVDAIMDVLHQWAARDYAGAMAWVAGFPEGPIRDRGLEELANSGGGGSSPLLTEAKRN
jgi:hypothetical protein